MKKARKAKREGKAPTTQAGEYVRVEIDKIRRVSTARDHQNRPLRIFHRSSSKFREKPLPELGKGL